MNKVNKYYPFVVYQVIDNKHCFISWYNNLFNAKKGLSKYKKLWYKKVGIDIWVYNHLYISRYKSLYDYL